MMRESAMVPLKPRVSKCGTHWTVEMNRRGDFLPVERCHHTWEECIKIALRWMREGRVALVEKGSYLDPATQLEMRLRSPSP